MQKRNGIWKGIVKQTSGVDDVSCAVALRFQTELSEADMETEG